MCKSAWIGGLLGGCVLAAGAIFPASAVSDAQRQFNKDYAHGNRQAEMKAQREEARKQCEAMSPGPQRKECFAKLKGDNPQQKAQ